MQKLLSRFKIVALYGLGQSINPIGLLIISLIVIKFKSIEFWGNFVELFIWVNLLLLFVSFGNKDQLLKRFSLSPSSIYQEWLTNFLGRSVIMIPCFVIIFLMPHFDEFLVWIIIWLILGFVNQSFNSLILFNRNFKFNAIVEIIANSLIIALVMTLNISLDLSDLIIIILLGNVIRAILYAIYYSKHLVTLKVEFHLNGLKEGIPFFIPLALGTARIKMDTYFATTIFDSYNLGKYQILINFLSIGQLLLTFVFNPYIKSFYRLRQKTIKHLKFQFLVFGFIFSMMYLFVSYFMISKIYKLHFSWDNYITSIIFLIPLGLQMLLVQQIYKLNKQYFLISVSLFVIVLQVTLGYYLMSKNGIDGALWVKSGSQWIITILLWIWSRNAIKNEKKYSYSRIS